jgi:TatD DNase family protein
MPATAKDAIFGLNPADIQGPHEVEEENIPPLEVRAPQLHRTREVYAPKAPETMSRAPVPKSVVRALAAPRAPRSPMATIGTASQPGIAELPQLLGADSHFHALKLQAWSKCSLAIAITTPAPPEPLRIDTMVPSYCWPESWPTTPPNLPEAAAKIAIGWHPTRSDKFGVTGMMEKMEVALHLPCTTALGEIGLDYYRGLSADIQVQQRELLQVMALKARELHLPVVIHCRDVRGDTSATNDCLRILASVLRKDHYVYLHCFNYGLDVAFRWIQRFPNLFLGVSPVILDPQARHPGLVDVICNLAEDKLLLETDSPYLIPASLKDIYKAWGSPTMIYYIAKEVSSLRHETLDHTLKAARAATLTFYSFARL